MIFAQRPLLTQHPCYPSGPHMATRFTAATTRTATAAARKDLRENLLQITQVISSPETQLKYQIERLLGQGGFGQVYLARRLGRSSTVPDVVCIKVSRRIDGWLREAYFGQLLDGHALHCGHDSHGYRSGSQGSP